VQEFALRREAGYPPFVRLASVLSQHATAPAAEQPLQRLTDALAPQVGKQLLQVLGPAPAPLERLQGQYRYHLLLKCAPDAEPADLLAPALANASPPTHAPACASTSTRCTCCRRAGKSARATKHKYAE
jgi:primosomal protein N'